MKNLSTNELNLLYDMLYDIDYDITVKHSHVNSTKSIEKILKIVSKEMRKIANQLEKRSLS